MNTPIRTAKQPTGMRSTLVLLISIVAMAAMSACGSTKVYNNDKTVVYNGAIYNVSKANQIAGKITAKLSDTETVSLNGVDKKQVEAYLDEYDRIYVRMAFQLDDREMLYRASSVSKWSEYSRMLKSFEKAEKQIFDLMGHKKKMQLKLK